MVGEVLNGRPNGETGMPENIWIAKQKGKWQAKIFYIFLDCQKILKALEVFSYYFVVVMVIS